MTAASGQERSWWARTTVSTTLFFSTEEHLGQTTSEGARAPRGAGEAVSFPLPRLCMDKPSPNRLGERAERGNKTPTQFLSVEHPLNAVSQDVWQHLGAEPGRCSRLPSITAGVCTPGRCKSPAERSPAPASGMGGPGPPSQANPDEAGRGTGLLQTAPQSPSDDPQHFGGPVRINYYY